MADQPEPLAKRLGWFALIWVISIAAVFAVAWLIKLVLN